MASGRSIAVAGRASKADGPWATFDEPAAGGVVDLADDPADGPGNFAYEPAPSPATPKVAGFLTDSDTTIDLKASLIRLFTLVHVSCLAAKVVPRFPENKLQSHSALTHLVCRICFLA